MAKIKIHLMIIVVFLLLLMACSNKAPKDSHLIQLNRIDVEIGKADGSYEEGVMISDKETIDIVRKTLKHIKWEPNTEPKMARKEDVKATLFFKLDQNMPERLYEYQVWFFQNNSATIISNHKNKVFGTLDKDHALILENIFLSK